MPTLPTTPNVSDAPAPVANDNTPSTDPSRLPSGSVTRIRLTISPFWEELPIPGRSKAKASSSPSASSSDSDSSGSSSSSAGSVASSSGSGSGSGSGSSASSSPVASTSKLGSAVHVPSDPKWHKMGGLGSFGSGWDRNVLHHGSQSDSEHLDPSQSHPSHPQLHPNFSSSPSSSHPHPHPHAHEQSLRLRERHLERYLILILVFFLVLRLGKVGREVCRELRARRRRVRDGRVYEGLSDTDSHLDFNADTPLDTSDDDILNPNHPSYNERVYPDFPDFSAHERVHESGEGPNASDAPSQSHHRHTSYSYPWHRSGQEGYDYEDDSDTTEECELTPISLVDDRRDSDSGLGSDVGSAAACSCSRSCASFGRRSEVDGDEEDTAVADDGGEDEDAEDDEDEDEAELEAQRNVMLYQNDVSPPPPSVSRRQRRGDGRRRDGSGSHSHSSSLCRRHSQHPHPHPHPHPHHRPHSQSASHQGRRPRLSIQTQLQTQPSNAPSSRRERYTDPPPAYDSGVERRGVASERIEARGPALVHTPAPPSYRD